MKIIKWGIIGTGNISSTFTKALNSLEYTEVTAVASRDMNRAKEFANQFQIEKAYDNYEELARDPEIDVVYIGTPNTEHKANAALCITNGKSVLCEKPFAINQQETQYLISLAKVHNVFLMEAMWTKFLPATKKVKQWIKEKLIGEVKFFDISFGFYNEYDESSRLYKPELGGGALLDVGVYPISYVIFMMDQLPDQVNSSAYLGKSNVDEMNVISFVYNEGVMANISSAIAADLGDSTVIIGDKGKIVIRNFWTAEGAELYDSNGKMVDSFLQPFTSNGYVYEAKEVNQCIRDGKKESSVVPLQDTLNIMKIMDQLRSSWGVTYPQESSNSFTQLNM